MIHEWPTSGLRRLGALPWDQGPRRVAGGLVVAIVTLLTMDIDLPGGLIEGTHDLATARTAVFMVLVLAHLISQALSARTIRCP